jgi:hypothetical protein
MNSVKSDQEIYRGERGGLKIYGRLSSAHSAVSAVNFLSDQSMRLVREHAVR